VVFNYATGPVEMERSHRAAMTTGPANSHSPEGQLAVTAALDRLRAVLAIPETFELLILPGSIRQALHAVVDALAAPGQRCLALDTGYWGEFIGDLLAARLASVTRTQRVATESVGQFDLVTAVHMETETGLMEPLDALRTLREGGATTIVDAACTIPIHALEWAVADVVVLGSHKCLAGPPGLGLVAIRDAVDTTSNWPLEAYRQDARARRSGASLPAPLVTYPLELVLGLDAAVRHLLSDARLVERRLAAAERLRAGLIDRGLDVVVDDRASMTVTRVDLPSHVDADAFRSSLGDLGYFVIGNVGSATGGSIRIGTMSEAQVLPGNIDRLLEAIDTVKVTKPRNPTPNSEKAEHV
jgi:aspartate aminotransferase-like enzyme